ncbi:TonB-dependent siderophore receptor [Paraglaciecola sp. MB-3u-78]|uniref:TonB-dependent receptor plug domain-containing protein n=1 Tax=Paraglaciecola sp. MB-3u-78 TaxID=2058332 RepID=UPI000C3363F7|nr:TonB-dependent receptor [Paraglaciecola sp. MB-3u-78]PKG99137.1 TonB-dependent receptor [Paraglaciecola sp. MB-3u-78]
MMKPYKFQGLTIAISLTLVSSSAYAIGEQTAPVTPDEKIEQIVVVGSRGDPRSLADSPVPIDVIDGEELSKSGNTDMLELLKGAIPSLNVHVNPISDAATLIRPANLRGLPSDSTLILLNGKRRHRASVITFLGGGINDGSQGPDISVIPSIALKQVEVLRDGAAAQYGSDAIAGVINFVLKDYSEGGTLEARIGQYYEGDGTLAQIAGNIGLPLSYDGFVNLSFQLKNAAATSRSSQIPDAQALIDAGNSAVPSITQFWGSPEIKDDITVFGNLGLDINKDKKFYMFGNYSKRDVRGGFYFRHPHTRGQVYSDGDTDGDGVRNLLIGDLDGLNSGQSCDPVNITTGNVLTQQDYLNNVANNDNCFAFNEILPGGFTPNFGGEITDTSLVIGTRGEYESILYDFSGSVGRNASTYFIYNTINPSMGPESPRDFNPGKYIQLEKYVNLNLVKNIDVGLYENLNLAGGIEWHEETFSVESDDPTSYEVGPLTEQGFGIGSNGFPGFQPSQLGDFTDRNYAAYIDVEAYYTENFMMSYALRYEDYDTFGSTTNYKVSALYEVNDELSIRASTSTGFRAPTVGQANVSNVSSNFVAGKIVDTVLLSPTTLISEQLGGIELTPEESKNYTFGLVYNYGEFFFTADYYSIKVTDRITQSNNITLSESDKSILKAAGVPNVEQLAQVRFFTNDFDTMTQGVDLVANYATVLFGGYTKLSAGYNWNDTRVDNFSEITGDFKVKRLEKDLPQQRAIFTVTQDWEDLSAMVRVNYYGEYHAVHIDWHATAKTASASVTLDAQVTYFVSDGVNITLGAQNLLDQQAEEIDFDAFDLPNNNWGGKYYETSPYGFNGGFYYISVKYSF